MDVGNKAEIHANYSQVLNGKDMNHMTMMHGINQVLILIYKNVVHNNRSILLPTLMSHSPSRSGRSNVNSTFKRNGSHRGAGLGDISTLVTSTASGGPELYPFPSKDRSTCAFDSLHPDICVLQNKLCCPNLVIKVRGSSSWLDSDFKTVDSYRYRT